MPRGYRCIVFAVVGWLALCGAKPSGQPVPNPPAASQQESTPDTGPSAASEPYRPYPRVKDADCYRDKNHDSADLCAQWRAALAAEEATQDGHVANIVAGIGAGLSFVSVILVLIALGQTRRSNKIAEDTAKRQLRAYVSIKETDLIFSPGRQKARLTIKWSNAGQTPARHALTAMEYYFADRGWREIPVFSFPDQGHTKAPIGPGCLSELLKSELDLSSDYDKWINGERDLFVFTTMKYEDVFGDSHLTTSRWVVAGDVDQGPPKLLFEDIGNEMT